MRPKLTKFHQFGSPIYILCGPLQTGQQVPKLQSRARLGIYLGMSPKHARSVALVLNLPTRLVSLQWHIKCDDNFDTIDPHTVDPTNGHWKCMAGLVTVTGETAPSKLGGVLGSIANQTSRLIPPPLSSAQPASDGVAGLQGVGGTESISYQGRASNCSLPYGNLQ